MIKNNLSINTKLSVEQLGSFFELIPVAISITTIDEGIFIYVNKYFEKLFVCKRKDILNKKSTDLKIITLEHRHQVAFRRL